MNPAALHPAPEGIQTPFGFQDCHKQTPVGHGRQGGSHRGLMLPGLHPRHCSPPTSMGGCEGPMGISQRGLGRWWPLVVMISGISPVQSSPSIHGLLRGHTATCKPALGSWWFGCGLRRSTRTKGFQVWTGDWTGLLLLAMIRLVTHSGSWGSSFGCEVRRNAWQVLHVLRWFRVWRCTSPGVTTPRHTKPAGEVLAGNGTRAGEGPD